MSFYTDNTINAIARQTNLTHGISINAGTSTIQSGFKGYFRMPYDGDITSWGIVGDLEGSAVFDLWVASGTSPSASDSITGSNKPTISNEQNANSSDLTGWTTSFSAGDIVGYNLESSAEFRQLQLILNVTTR